MPDQASFSRDFRSVNEFYGSPEGLQRPGGMVIDRDGIPTCDVEAMQQWGWQLSQGTPLSSILQQIRQSDEWRTKHAGDVQPPAPPQGEPPGGIVSGNGHVFTAGGQ